MSPNQRPTSLESWSPKVFLLAGGILVLFASHSALQTVTGTTYPVVQELIAPFGFWLGVIGLLSLYSAIDQGSSRLPQVAAIFAGASFLNWSVILAKNLGGAAGVVGELGTLTMVTGILAFVTMFFSFVLFGLAGYRVGGLPRPVWILMLLEGAIWLHILIIYLTPLSIPLFVFETGHFISHLGIGITLWRHGVSRGAIDATPDVTA